jgi:non-heme chloroperoxidase
MSTVTTKDGVQIFYKDWGQGQPVVFHHGWPLSADDWDTQMLFFVQQGYRVIGIDRRGHGRSSQISDDHDMDHYAADAAAVIASATRYTSAIPPAAEKWPAMWRVTAKAGSPKPC